MGATVGWHNATIINTILTPSKITTPWCLLEYWGSWITGNSHPNGLPNSHLSTEQQTELDRLSSEMEKYLPKQKQEQLAKLVATERNFPIPSKSKGATEGGSANKTEK